ncbi:class A beta-lactamase-related serine hydrolase [Arthrobacter sp. PAMC25564]|uniref:serine hydrolase domain-containing protein n=1 Tax=Arthrobacter sp. PAMC25564 TaxID=2565366 RepID=UPI0010A24E59|nr:serine hydrolase domain-containing protein [Arthrobacter sp. PAMC25564]QCB97811.1 class A beta-lactamase-related serine hydrolase [Arthrobacter sp. PAMC25564]
MTTANRARRRLRRSFTAVCLAAALLAVSACTGSGPPQPGSTSSATSTSTAPATATATDTTATSTAAAPALLPLDKAQLQKTFEDTAKELLVPGAVVLLRTPEGGFTSTYGVSNLGGNAPVSLDDHIRIGSITKTWTGTVILQLVQEGRLKLSDPVAIYRADVPNGANITIEQLLTMRSGLYNYSESYELNLALDTTPQRVWTPEELLAIALPLPVYFAPGQGFHYSNTNTVLLGLIAEKLEGKPLARIIQDRILGPLGLSQTSFPPSDSNVLPSPHPQGYMYMTNVLTIASSQLPADLIARAKAGTLAPNDYTNSNPSWAWAAGQGISTAGDLATWAEAITGGKLLRPELQKVWLDSPRPVDPNDAGGALYGLALAKFGQLYGHTGELPGFNSFMGSDPVNKVTLVVWTNLAPSADGRDPAAVIARALIGGIYAPAASPSPGSSE